MYITIDQVNPKLLLVEPPQFNESFQGYILRLTHLNLYDRVTWIYEFMSMTKDYKRRSSMLSQEMEALHKVTGLQQNQLQNLIFRRLNEKIFSEVMNFNQKHKCKICPKCLEEKGFYNGIWEIAFITVCPEHQCLLIDKCPNCYTTISWNRNNIFTCLCKYDLRKCKTEVIHKQFLYKFSALINSKINNFSNEINHSNPLYGLDVLSILRLINLIGLKIVFTLKHGGKIPYKLFENSELSVVVGKAFGVFEEWPKNFMVFLDNLKEDNENGSRGIMKDFGKFYQSIKSYDEFDFLFNAFEYYVFQNKDRYISPSFSRIFKKGFDHFDYITGTEAANSLGLKLYSIQELVKKQDLNGIINENKHFTLCLVNKSSVGVLKYKMKNWYSTRRARELLNINEHVFLGFISFFEYIEIPYKSGAKRRYFKPEVIDEVLTVIDKKVCYKETYLISIDRAVKLINGIMKKYSFVQIYQDLIENNIIPRGIDENSIGIRRYLFCHEEITEFAEITLKKSNVDTYSMGETANLLGIRLGDLRAFIKKGLIKKVRNDSRPRIPKIEIELFKSKFVDLNEIRKRYKFDFHPTVNSLIGKGIYPIMGPIVDGSRKYLYTRKSILQVSIKT